MVHSHKPTEYMTDGLSVDQYGEREHWGLKMNWTPQHLKPKDLEPWLHTWDTTASDAVERLNELAPANSSTPEEKKHRRDLYELMQNHADKDEKVGKLWKEINTVPDWVDWDQIERGQKVYWRYGGAAITSLTFLSLLGGMGSARVVETLGRTGGFAADAVRRRLLETAQHTLNVHRDLAALKPGGDGFVNSVQVRMLHASVRNRVLKMAKERPEYFNLAEIGVPINDNDSAGTIMTFSSMTVWMGLPRQGIYLSDGEIRDYLAVWRWVAYIMGSPHDWLDTPESAKRMMESMLVAEIKPSAASADLANNIMTGFQDLAPTYASRGFMAAQVYMLNGDSLSKALDIERPSLYYRALIWAQSFLFMVVARLNQTFTWIDEYNGEAIKQYFYTVLLHDKAQGALGYKTRFNFRYVPTFERESTPRGPSPKDRLSLPYVAYPGVERTALVVLLFCTASVAFTAWGGYRLLQVTGLGL